MSLVSLSDCHLGEERSFFTSTECFSSGQSTASMIGTLKLGGNPSFAESLECLGGPAMFLPWLAACFTIPNRMEKDNSVSKERSSCDCEEIFLSFLLLLRSILAHDVFFKGSGNGSANGYTGKHLESDSNEHECEFPWIGKLVTAVESILFRIPSSHMTPVLVELKISLFLLTMENRQFFLLPHLL
eukprot:756732-Hanusia_phi.AAC.8